MFLSKLTSEGAPTSLLVEFKSRCVRITRRKDFEELLQTIRFHIPEILAEEGIELYTNDLPTGKGQWIELTAPYWPYVQPTTHLLKVKLSQPHQHLHHHGQHNSHHGSCHSTPTAVLSPMRTGGSGYPGCMEYFINVELPVVGRTLSVAVKASTPLSQVLQVVAGQIRHELSRDDHRFSFNGVTVPMDDILANWDIQCNDTIVLLEGKASTIADKISDIASAVTSPISAVTSTNRRRFQLDVIASETGKTLALMVTHDTKVDALKHEIETRLGIPSCEQVYSFNGSKVADGQVLLEIGITGRACVEMFPVHKGHGGKSSFKDCERY
ncbi:hypothetical protein BKA70DRAFT_1403186 [Coprinopsis sp. MPI-PUGE-AT-0042]|nr:hypothetical protein BKA70DRAFT_1403186 [Coprinopsis sp. MPI-PUGE-AT-0042]